VAPFAPTSGKRSSTLGRAELDAFVDRLIGQVEARQLSFGRGMGDALDRFVTRNGRASATEDDQAARDAFLGADADVIRHEIAILVDVWH
jgi:hypothetical protein